MSQGRAFSSCAENLKSRSSVPFLPAKCTPTGSSSLLRVKGIETAGCQIIICRSLKDVKPENPGTAICSCNDGLRPVIFRLEGTDIESHPE